MPRCQGRTKSSGMPCKCHAMKDEKYCQHHINQHGDHPDGCLATTNKGEQCTKLGNAQYGGYCYVHRHMDDDADVIDDRAVMITYLKNENTKLRELIAKQASEIVMLRSQLQKLRMAKK